MKRILLLFCITPFLCKAQEDEPAQPPKSASPIMKAAEFMECMGSASYVMTLAIMHDLKIFLEGKKD